MFFRLPPYDDRPRGVPRGVPPSRCGTPALCTSEVGETRPCVPRCVVSAWGGGARGEPGDTGTRQPRPISTWSNLCWIMTVASRFREPVVHSRTSWRSSRGAAQAEREGSSRHAPGGRRHRRANGTGGRSRGCEVLRGGPRRCSTRPIRPRLCAEIHASASAAISPGQMSDSTAVPAAGPAGPAVRLQAKVCTVSDGVVGRYARGPLGRGRWPSAFRQRATKWSNGELSRTGSSRWPKRSRNWPSASTVLIVTTGGNRLSGPGPYSGGHLTRARSGSARPFRGDEAGQSAGPPVARRRRTIATALVLNLPGSTKGALECLGGCSRTCLPHASPCSEAKGPIEQRRDGPHRGKSHGSRHRARPRACAQRRRRTRGSAASSSMGPARSSAKGRRHLLAGRTRRSPRSRWRASEPEGPPSM